MSEIKTNQELLSVSILTQVQSLGRISQDIFHNYQYIFDFQWKILDTYGGKYELQKSH